MQNEISNKKEKRKKKVVSVQSAVEPITYVRYYHYNNVIVFYENKGNPTELRTLFISKAAVYYIAFAFAVTSPATTQTTPVPGKACDGHPLPLTSSSGVLTSPGYDGSSPYLGHQSCQWLITAPQGEVVTIKFSDFETENSGGCDYDFVVIYDGTDFR